MVTTKAASATTATPIKYPTVDEFCERFRISRWLYYKMRAVGDGPQEVHVGSRKIVITLEAIEEWQRQHSTGTS